MYIFLSLFVGVIGWIVYSDILRFESKIQTLETYLRWAENDNRQLKSALLELVDMGYIVPSETKALLESL